MGYRAPSVPLDGLVRVLGALGSRATWTPSATPSSFRLTAPRDLGVPLGALVLAAIAAGGALYLGTLTGLWADVARIGAWIVCGFCVVATPFLLRRRSLTIDVAAKRIHGDDLHYGAIDASFTDVRAIEIVRRPRADRDGSASLSFDVGGTLHPIVELDGVGLPALVRIKGLALGFAVLLETDVRDRSTREAAAALAPADREAGLPASGGGDASLLDRAREAGAHVANRAKPLGEALEGFLRVLEGLST